MKKRRLALAISLGPLAWILDFTASVMLVPHVHATRSKLPLYVASGVAVLLAAIGIVLARQARPSAYSTGERFIARAAPLSNAVFLVVILGMAFVEAAMDAGA